MKVQQKRSFRLVCEEHEIPLVEELLLAQGFAFEPEPFSKWCRVCTEEPFALGDSLASTFGLLYIQDRSSMLPPLMLAPDEGAHVLDMCASPGSKTGFLGQLVGKDGFVLGNEPGRDRLETLRQNMRRLNLFNVATCFHPGEKLPLHPGSFHFIQLDPPCSGWGTVDKNPNVMKLWTEEKTGPLVVLQRKLLEKAYELLAPGGRVLYSTCTTNVAENEEQVEFAQEIGFELVGLEEPAGFVFEEPLLGQKGVLRVDQAASNAQGFFLAAFKKPDDAVTEAPLPRKLPLPGRELHPREIARAKGSTIVWENLPEGALYDFNGKLFFLPRPALYSQPQLRWQGFLIGKLAKGMLKPAPLIRRLLPEADSRFGLITDSVQDLENLLRGTSLQTTSPGTGLYYKGLKLGTLTRKGDRALWSGR